ncbi:hypothetical protein D3C78_1811290 [compost metagenome]
MQQPLCRFPGCTQRSDQTFALVPLCEEHAEAIWAETRDYYSKRLNAAEQYMRPLYRRIEMDIPWSRARMGKLK